MMNGSPLISSDSHVIEPPETWTERIDPRYRDRAPRLVAEEEADWWHAEDLRLISFIGGIQPGLRFEEPERMRREGRFDEVWKGAYLPQERVKDMDADGVDIDILYPTVSLLIYGIRETGYLTAVCDGYNRWLAEFCGAYPDRLKGIAVINIDDVESGVRQLEQAARLGLVGAMVPAYQPDESGYHSPAYDPLWAAAQDMKVPLSLHVATNRPDPTRGFATPATSAVLEYWAEVSIANMVLSGVFERFPGLNVVSVEHEAAWAAHFQRQLDYVYTQRVRREDWPRYSDARLPSDFFKSNVLISFQEDGLAIELRDRIGVETLMWGSDYPHAESTFPKTQEILADILSGVPDSERAMIVGGNAARVYGM